MSSHIAKSESKTSLLKAAAASGGSRAPRHGPARDPGLPSRRLPGSCPGTPQSSGDPSSRRPLCWPAPREEGARGSQRGLPQAHCRPREALLAAASRPSPSSPLPPARGRDGEERGLSPALGLRGSLRAPGRGDSVPAAASEADPFLHRLRPMLSSAFGQDRSLRPEEIEGKTWPLGGKDCLTLHEGVGREVDGKRGPWEWGLMQHGLSSVKPAAEGVHKRQEKYPSILGSSWAPLSTLDKYFKRSLSLKSQIRGGSLGRERSLVKGGNDTGEGAQLWDLMLPIALLGRPLLPSCLL
ncbi:hypothetical protein H8959_014379 [Pygathrix nigripes]